MIPAKRQLALSSSDSDASPPSRRHSHRRAEIVESVFRAVQAEFYAWDRDHAQEYLAKVASEHGGTSPLLVGPITSTPDHLRNDTTEGFQVTDFESGKTYDMLPAEVVVVQSPFSSTLSYESCTPSASNIFRGDDSDDMPFIPFADDPEFQSGEHLKKYKYRAWQRLFFDPDLQTITIETARRLVQDHEMSFEEIDNTAVLPLNLLRMGTNGGVLLTDKHHDYLRWRPSHSEFSVPKPNISIRSEFETMLVGQFCNFMNCLVGFCDAHPGFDVPLPLKVQPTLVSNNLFGNVIKPCSEHCFILGVGGSATITDWTAEEVDALSITLDYAPDTSPCDLAVICRKPCIEVFRRRKILLPDAGITKPKLKKTSTSAHVAFNDFNPTVFTPNIPCRHEGACNSRTSCACALNSAHCERSCRCPRTCRRRWSGCSCSKNKQGSACGTDRCPCFKAHRECDPEICGKCEAKDPASNICKNVALQRGVRKATEVKDSVWGLGLFLLEPTNEDELITEYVGELIYEATTISRDDVAQYRKRNYLFDLNSSLAIDSTYVGNEARYINHGVGFNCRAAVKLVNGEHRIGIYACIRLEAGSELLLNYGQDFFR